MKKIDFLKKKFWDEFKKGFAKAFVKELKHGKGEHATKEQKDKQDSTANAFAIAYILDNVELNEKDTLCLISRLSRKHDLYPIIYRRKEVKFIFEGSNVNTKFRLVSDNYN